MRAAASSGRRHRSRELALRVLFELEGTQKDAAEVLEYQARDMRVPADVEGFARRLVQATLEHLAEIDTELARASRNWPLEELGKVERAVLRLGCSELRHMREVPAAVAIDESVELAKSYAGEDAAAYVNGVLGGVAREAA